MLSQIHMFSSSLSCFERVPRGRGPFFFWNGKVGYLSSFDGDDLHLVYRLIGCGRVVVLFVYPTAALNGLFGIRRENFGRYSWRKASLILGETVWPYGKHRA
jgi:hypothetical protein